MDHHLQGAEEEADRFPHRGVQGLWADSVRSVPGNEKTTPDEVLAYRTGGNQDANSSGWQVRVVPNKYPALVIEGDLEKEGEGLYDRMNGIGAHEVIIESPDHQDRF